MPTLQLKPSEIFFSQATISGHFGRWTRHKHQDIGNTLDNLYYGRSKIRDIPTISVVKKDEKWVTLDNRRLWIFHHLQGAGKCDTIPVNEVNYYECLVKHSGKFSSKNGGTSISFSHRNGPGGKCHRCITPVIPRLPTKTISKTTSRKTVSVKETKTPTTLSSTTSTTDIKTTHTHSRKEPNIDAMSVKHEDRKLNNTTNKDFSIQTHDYVVKIKTTDGCISIKADRDQIRTKNGQHSGEGHSTLTSDNQSGETFMEKLLKTQKSLNKITKGVNRLKNKLNRQKKLKRQTHKTLKCTDTTTNKKRTAYTRLPPRQLNKMPTYSVRKPTYQDYLHAETLYPCRFPLDYILGHNLDDPFSGGDDNMPMSCSKFRVDWRKQGYHYYQTICKHSVNNSIFSNCDKISKYGSGEEISEIMYPSELDSEIDNYGSDVDNMEKDNDSDIDNASSDVEHIEKDYEDEQQYFYEFEDCHATFDTFQSIPTVSDTSEEEIETTDDDDDDDDYDVQMDDLSDNNNFPDIADEIEQEDDINAYGGYCFENELWAERNIQSLNESNILSDDDTDSDEEPNYNDTDDEEEEEFDENDTDDDEVRVEIINGHLIPECTYYTPFKKQFKDDEYQNKDKWFYDCFDKCYRRVKKYNR